MHRFFIRPESLGYQEDTFNRWDDPRWRALLDDFRWALRLREWKRIDRRFRLFVKVQEWDGSDVLLIANPQRDEVLVNAYVKAGFLEDQAIIVFAQDNIPWARLKPFRASPGGRSHRNSGARPKGSQERATSALGLPRSEPYRWALANRTGGVATPISSLVLASYGQNSMRLTAGGKTRIAKVLRWPLGLATICARGQRSVAVKNPLDRKERRRSLKG